MECGGAVAGMHLYCPELRGAAARMSSRETVSWSFSEDTVTLTSGPESRLSICVRGEVGRGEGLRGAAEDTATLTLGPESRLSVCVRRMVIRGEGGEGSEGCKGGRRR